MSGSTHAVMTAFVQATLAALSFIAASTAGYWQYEIWFGEPFSPEGLIAVAIVTVGSLVVLAISLTGLAVSLRSGSSCHDR